MAGTSATATAGTIADCYQLSAIWCLVANSPAPKGGHSMTRGFGSLKVNRNINGRLNVIDCGTYSVAAFGSSYGLQVGEMLESQALPVSSTATSATPGGGAHK